MLSFTAQADISIGPLVANADGTLRTSNPAGDYAVANAGKYRFTASGSTVDEGYGTTGRTAVERIDGNSGAVGVDQTIDGSSTCVEDTDYSLVTSDPYSKSWDDGASGLANEGAFFLDILTNNDSDQNCTIVFAFTNASGGISADSTNQTYTLTILNTAYTGGGGGGGGGGSSGGGVDTEFGPVSGDCPSIPSSFNNTYTATSSASFDTAYASATAGDAIVVTDGSYSGWGTKTISKSGTASNRLYILAETRGGVTFSSTTAFTLSGAYITVAGFNFNGSRPFQVVGGNNRVACNDQQVTSGDQLSIPTANTADNLEIDNNVFHHCPSHGIQINRCNPTISGCTHNALGIHIHHNTFTDCPADSNPSNDHEAIVMGLGYAPAPGVTDYNPDDSHMDMIVENNLFDNWQGEQELVTMKSSHNIVRFNCVRNSPNSVLVLRLGDYNLVYGNWSENAREGFRISGRHNIVAFNYFSKNSLGGAAGLRLHPGGLSTSLLYAYIEASDNDIEYNVFNRYGYMIQIMARSGTFVENPQGNTFSNNVFYSSSFTGTNSSGSYVDSSGSYNEASFRAANTWGTNTINGSNLAEEDTCFTPSTFDGPGTSISAGSDYLTQPATIDAPSWWATP